MRCDSLQLLVHRLLQAERVSEQLVATRPAACRDQRHDRPRPATRRQLQRDAAVERVAHDVRRLEACTVYRVLDCVSEQRVTDLILERRPTRMAWQRRRKNRVPV